MNRNSALALIVAAIFITAALCLDRSSAGTIMPVESEIAGIPAPTPTPSPSCTPISYGVSRLCDHVFMAGVTDIGNHCDDCTTTITLPFPVRLYDQSFTEVTVDSNGKAHFQNGTTEFANSCLPQTNAAFSVYPYWDDLRTDASLGACSQYPGGQCGIFTRTVGNTFTIEWRTVYYANNNLRANFELNLYAGQTIFNVFYGNPIDRGNTSATAGVQRDADDFTQHFCNGNGGSAFGSWNYNAFGCGIPTPLPTPMVTPTPCFLTPVPTPTPTATPTPTPSPTPTPGVPTPTPTVFEEGYVRLSSTAYDVYEGYTARIQVLAFGPPQPGFSARVVTSKRTAVAGTACTPGVDYITVDQYLGWYGYTGGQGGDVLVITCPDTQLETDETVQITLSCASNCILQTPNQAVLTIHANSSAPTPTPGVTPTPSPTPSCTPTFSYRSNTPIAAYDPFSYPPQLIAGHSDIYVDQPVTISNVAVRLYGLNHTAPDDIDLMLVGPGGENAIIMSDVGGNTSFAGDIVLDDNAFYALPDENPLSSGLFQPTNIGGGDTFPGGPVSIGGSALSVFNGTLADGTWSLWAVDDSQNGNIGSIAGGWELIFHVCPTSSPPPSPTPSGSPSPTPTPPSCFSAASLDITFDGDGQVTTPVLGGLDEAHSVAVQPDGKIVAAGRSRDGPYTYLSLARFNTNGSLDTSFGGDGKVATSFHGGYYDAARSVAIQPDGKIVVAGSGSSAPGYHRDFALVRYNPDGSRDTTFDDDGRVITVFGTGNSYAESVVIQPDGKIVAAGQTYNGYNYDFAVVRYLTDGSLDTSFDGDGRVMTHILNGTNDEAMSVALQADGKIVVSGSVNGFAVVRYNTDGSLDTSWNGDGIVITPVLSTVDKAYGVAIQPDGKVVVAGSAFYNSDYDFGVVRYNTDGSLDTTFDGDGKVTTPVLDGTDWGYSVAIQPDGRIVMAGAGITYSSGAGFDFALVRYNPDGSLDTTFDGDGKLRTPITNDYDYAYSVAIQPDGRIVAAGSSGGVLGQNSDFALVRYGAPCSVLAAPFDFDGDGRADVSVFRPGEANWYLLQSRDGFAAANFGLPTDKIAPADFDGDGKTDIGVYRPSNGTWYWLNSSNGTVRVVQFGAAADLPTPADYDGDRRADVSVFRPSNGSWYRLNSSDGSFYGVQFGSSGDKPTIGDYDGDGKADVAVWQPSNGTWYRLNSSNGGFVAAAFGLSTDLITPADFDGDAKTDIAVYRPSSGTWYWLNSSNGAFNASQFGIAEDIPSAADYDGDGWADICVFRPSSGVWYRLNSSNGGFVAMQFGKSGDRPTPAAFRY